MKKVIVFINVIFIVLFVGTFWVLGQYTDQTVYNLVDNTAVGAQQVVVVGRGITSPNLTSNATVETLLNTWYNAASGALQVYVDSSSGDIPFTNLSSLTNGDLLRYQSSDDSWVNTEGRVTLLDDTFEFAPSSDTTTCYRLYDADEGNPIFSIDCTNERVGIGTSAPGALMSVSSDGTGVLDIVADNDNNSLDTNIIFGFFVDGQRGIGTQKGTIGYDQGEDIVTLSYGAIGNYHLNIDDNGKLGIMTVSPNATLSTNGSQSVKRTDAGAANYNPSALTSDYLITANNSAAARAITISTEDVAAGTTALPRVFVIKDEYGSATTYNLTITLEGGGTIDGAASQTINSDYASIMLYCTGTNCFIY